jgi:hypothetical protein
VHSFYADVWKFSLRSQTWTRISSNTCEYHSGSDRGGQGAGFFSRLYANAATLSSNAASQCAPRVAHGASAVVGDALYTLCGLVHPTPEQEKALQRNIVASADVYRFDLVHHQWQRLRVRGVGSVGATPEERFATAAAAFSDKIFLFGGYSLKRHTNFHDLWCVTRLQPTCVCQCFSDPKSAFPFR